MTEETKGPRSANYIDSHVGAKIRVRRQALRISQEKLGEALGVTFQQVQKYERGSNRVGASRLYGVAQALEVPVSYFFEGLDQVDQLPDDEENVIEDFIRSQDGVAFAIALADVPKPVRVSLLALIRSLGGKEEAA